ncbi:MAG: hypothetical protein ABI207_09315 [Crocinitomicaceae bacterium]
MIQASPYEYYAGTLCVRKPFLVDEESIITHDNYKNLTKRGQLYVLRPGKGKSNYALIEFESMRADIKAKVIAIQHPSSVAFNLLTNYIKPDNEAIRFFANYQNNDNRSLDPKKQRIYATNAILLNACKDYERKHIGRLKISKIWQNISDSINTLEDYEFKLPANSKALRVVYDKYIDGSYMSLVHGGEGNNNSRKVNEQLEDLILSIYCMKNKPFSSTVQQIYLQFLGGALEIVDQKTGELFDPKEFEKDGKPLVISEATVWNYINDPKNRTIVDKYRSGSLQFNNEHRPHHHRHSPTFSLSKISLDDRDLPRKMLNGKRVKAYYAYDVTSGCVIGASFSRDKDTKLFLDCIKDMLLFLDEKEMGIPMEMEVEHHLVNRFKNDLMKAGVAFPFVRWCGAGNSQEKRAEHFNKAKKYGFEKRYQDGIGRWYAKSEAHRTIVEKVFDSENNNYKEKKYEYDELVADDREIIEKYNNGLHPNQKKYKGMSRMDVLTMNINPNLAKFDEVIWAKYVGNCTPTTIRRSQYVTVQHAKYQLPSVGVLELLQPNNYSVDAYYLPSKDGNIPTVVLYQNDQYICECEKIITYNEATSEQTEDDLKARVKQAQYVKSFDESIKRQKERIGRIHLLENVKPIQLPPLNTIEEPIDSDLENDFDEILSAYNPEAVKQQAKNNL